MVDGLDMANHAGFQLNVELLDSVKLTLKPAVGV